jgi:hypothetical protein
MLSHVAVRLPLRVFCLLSLTNVTAQIGSPDIAINSLPTTLSDGMDCSLMILRLRNNGRRQPGILPSLRSTTK